MSKYKNFEPLNIQTICWGLRSIASSIAVNKIFSSIIAIISSSRQTKTFSKVGYLRSKTPFLNRKVF
jgi:hypothetical protein